MVIADSHGRFAAQVPRVRSLHEILLLPAGESEKLAPIPVHFSKLLNAIHLIRTPPGPWRKLFGVEPSSADMRSKKSLDLFVSPELQYYPYSLVCLTMYIITIYAGAGLPGFGDIFVGLPAGVV